MMRIFINADCMLFMRGLVENCVDFTLTDIPYIGVSRASNGLRNLDKSYADVETFDLLEFLEQVYRVTKSAIAIFCGFFQFSLIYKFFAEKQGTTRIFVWQKTNPSPMNGTRVYLSGAEIGVWFKKPRGVFNAHCKNSVFLYPTGRSKIHPTEKNHALLEELIRDNTSPHDIVFDPCAGSGSTLLAAAHLGRQYAGCEIHTPYYLTALARLRAEGCA